MDLYKLSQELPKYRVVFEGLSILPFALKLGIYYLPTEKKVGEVSGFFGRITGWLEIQEPKIKIEFKDGKWYVEAVF